MRLLYNASLLFESLVFLKSIKTDVLSHYTLILSAVSDGYRISDR